VTVTLNSGAVITPFLNGVDQLPIDTTVVAVDNGSTDSTLHRLAASRAVQTIAGHGNVGFGAAMNIGVREAPSEAVLLLNPDARPIAADAAMLRRFVRYPGRAGITACAVVDDHARKNYLIHPETHWREDLASFLSRCFLKPRCIHVPRRPPIGHGSRWASGAALLVKRSEFLDVGGFDERYFMYFEDRDLCRRFSRQGFPTNKSAAVCVEHVGTASTPAVTPIRTAWTLLGLVEYTAIHSGANEARKTADAVIRALAAVRRSYTRLAELTGADAISRKAREADAVHDELGVKALATAARTSAPFYPEALSLLGGHR
jgi:GT2 family glycosyltransferase